MKIEKANKDLVEMAVLGDFSPKYTVRVYQEGGPTPHFHIDNKQTGESCCVRIDKAEYFNHEKHMTKFLTAKLKKNLVDWLNSNSSDYSILNINLTLYQNICILWNQNNPNWKLEKIPDMPNYLEIE